MEHFTHHILFIINFEFIFALSIQQSLRIYFLLDIHTEGVFVLEKSGM